MPDRNTFELTCQDHEINSDGWQLYRGDRKNRLCGGVVIYIREEFLVSNKLSYSTTYCDIVGIYIPTINLVVITFYRPPNCK